MASRVACAHRARNVITTTRRSTNKGVHADGGRGMQRCSSELAKFKMVKPRQHSATLPDKFPERHVQKPRTVRTCLRARRMMMALQGVTPKENGDDGERCKSPKLISSTNEKLVQLNLNFKPAYCGPTSISACARCCDTEDVAKPFDGDHALHTPRLRRWPRTGA